jgi:hypothetical protein
MSEYSWGYLQRTLLVKSLLWRKQWLSYGPRLKLSIQDHPLCGWFDLRVCYLQHLKVPLSLRSNLLHQLLSYPTKGVFCLFPANPSLQMVTQFLPSYILRYSLFVQMIYLPVNVISSKPFDRLRINSVREINHGQPAVSLAITRFTPNCIHQYKVCEANYKSSFACP